MEHSVLDKRCPEEPLVELLELVNIDDVRAWPRLEELLLNYPSDARLHFLRGSLKAAQREYVEALSDMRYAVSLDAGYEIARFQLGLLELSSGEALSSVATLQPLAEGGVSDALRHFARGLSLMTHDQLQAAILELEAGLSMNTEFPEVGVDMQRILGELRQMTTNNQGKTEQDVQHLLLSGYAGSSTTKH